MLNSRLHYILHKNFDFQPYNDAQPLARKNKDQNHADSL